MTTYRSLLDIITAAGLTSGLKHCSDAGDGASYSGSGQTVVDRSGNGSDFTRGATSSTETSDPTFAGSAGGLSVSDRFTLDGGDYLRLAIANPTWAQNLHRNNALATLLVAYKYKTGGTQGLIGSSGANSLNAGIVLLTNSSGQLALIVGRAGTTVLASPTLAMPGSDGYVIVAATINENGGAGQSFLFMNGSVVTFDGAYATPATGSASFTLEIMARGNAAQPQAAGAEFFGAAIWEGAALTQADVTDLYNELGLRLGLVAGGDAALSGDGSLAASGSAEAFGSASLSGDSAPTCSGDIEEETPPEEPIYAVATLPVAAFEEPTVPEDDDLLRLNTSAVIDLAYLVELRPFAPAGTTLPS